MIINDNELVPQSLDLRKVIDRIKTYNNGTIREFFEEPELKQLIDKLPTDLNNLFMLPDIYDKYYTLYIMVIYIGRMFRTDNNPDLECLVYSILFLIENLSGNNIDDTCLRRYVLIEDILNRSKVLGKEDFLLRLIVLLTIQGTTERLILATINGTDDQSRSNTTTL